MSDRFTVPRSSFSNFWDGRAMKELPADTLIGDETPLLQVVDYGEKGKGLKAKSAIPKGTRVFGVHGSDKETSSEEESRYLEDSSWNLSGNPDALFPNAILVGRKTEGGGTVKNIWLDPKETCPLRFLNHSCNPNLGRSGPYTFVAMRDIQPGEELTADYSTLEANPAWHMECKCGSEYCRGTIRSVQSLSPELAEQYFPFMPQFLQRIYIENLEHNQRDEFKMRVRDVMNSI